MCRNSSLRRAALPIASVFLCILLPLLAETCAQSPEQTNQRASLSMEQEHHHHLEFENSYVRVFFVEIPAHDSTLFHRHDFPYISVPPTGAGAAMPPLPDATQQGSDLPRVAYSPGNFSHTVSNSRDFPLRNVAVELLRPQGAIRNRCAQVIRDQPYDHNCGVTPSVVTPAVSVPLFETDEIMVSAWRIVPGVGVPAANRRVAMLAASLSGITVTASGGVNSANALKGGLLWLPAGSKPVFKAGPDAEGHLITIAFKDSGPPDQEY